MVEIEMVLTVPSGVITRHTADTASHRTYIPKVPAPRCTTRQYVPDGVQTLGPAAAH